jgi:hypothetical protein
MTYEQTIRNLFRILHQCNAADGHNAADWQHPMDASSSTGAYGHIRKAIEALAGEDVIDHCAKTGELDPTLCDRSEEGKLAIHLGAMEERGEITLDGDYPTHSRVGGYVLAYVTFDGLAYCGNCIEEEDVHGDPSQGVLHQDGNEFPTECECCHADISN